MSCEPASQYTLQAVNNNRQVTLKAFLGRDGQTEYVLIMQLGPTALSRHARSLDIQECIPGPDDQSNRLAVDTARRTITIRLY